MNEDKIKIEDTFLALAILEELKRLKIIPKNEALLDRHNFFSKEELESVKQIELIETTVEDISELIYCINLTSLTIISRKAKDVKSSLQANTFDYIGYRDRIKDFSVISKLKSLQSLTIKNSPFLEKLDLSNLDNLFMVELVGNPNLVEVKGIETLPELGELTLVKNHKYKPFDMNKILEKDNLPYLTLDYDLYPLFKESCPDFYERATQKTFKFSISFFKWKENISDIRYNELSTYQLEKMYNKAKEVVNKIIGPDYTDIEKICAIYLYITSNVYYDHLGQESKKDKNKYRKLVKERHDFSCTGLQILDKVQSSYNALMNNMSVCEGYSNLMHYLLKMVGIESKTVSCSSNKNTQLVGANSNHSILKIYFGDGIYYFDPTNDRQSNKLHTFFKTKDEIELTLKLSMTEDDEESSIKKPYSNNELVNCLIKALVDNKYGINEIENRLSMIEKEKVVETDEDYIDECRRKQQYIEEELEKLELNSNQSKTNSIKKEILLQKLIRIKYSAKYGREQENNMKIIERLLNRHIFKPIYFYNETTNEYEIKIPDYKSLCDDYQLALKEIENLEETGIISFKDKQKYNSTLYHELDNRVEALKPQKKAYN